VAAYRLSYSDYAGNPAASPPATPTPPPGSGYRLHYADYANNASGPPDPERWVGPPGPKGDTGDTGPAGPTYTLPIATTSLLGGVKPDGTTVTVTGGGVISAMGGGGGPAASTTVPLIESGAGAVGVALSYARGDHVHPAAGGGYSLPIASTTVLGGVKVDGTSVTITGGGVISAVAAAAGVSSFNTRTGAVALQLTDVTGVGGAPLASPAFTGTPSLPTGTTGVTQTAGNSTTAVATTAFVAGAVAGGTAGVASFNTRVGIVTLSSLDVTTALTYTPYNSTNPSAYQTSANVVTAIAAGNPGSFSTLSASGAVSGTGFVNRFASPGPIGNTTASTGAFSTLSASGLITPASGVGIRGTTTVDNAQTGSIGEYVSSMVLTDAAVSLTSTVAAAVTSISLTAGDWDISAVVLYKGGSTTMVLYTQSSINTAPALLSSPGNLCTAYYYSGHVPFANVSEFSVVMPDWRVQLSATTTIYLVASGSFTTSTLAAFGVLRARRVR